MGRRLCVPIVRTRGTRTSDKITHLKQPIDRLKPSRSDPIVPPRLRLQRHVPHCTRCRITVLEGGHRRDKKSLWTQRCANICKHGGNITFADMFQDFPAVTTSKYKGTSSSGARTANGLVISAVKRLLGISAIPHAAAAAKNRFRRCRSKNGPDGGNPTPGRRRRSRGRDVQSCRLSRLHKPSRNVDGESCRYAFRAETYGHRSESRRKVGHDPRHEHLVTIS